MSAKNHRDFKEEVERLNYTLQYVDDSYEKFMNQREFESDKLSKLKKSSNSDSSQQYIDVMIQTMLSERIDLKIRNLEESKNKPYFARIDFSEEASDGYEKLYIGKMSLIKEEDNSLIIVDWRAPVSSLYYDGRIGKEHYSGPEGVISGELLLKRQFVINARNLEEILDVDVATSDELLQASLGSNADNRLNDIVSTIQTEQNKVIRADMFTPLIIQGVAGSGKTTIALHRIAYLIYTFEKSFIPENFMIIAPNKLFLNYISEVLPELGVQRVVQTTFEEFAMNIIGTKLKLTNPNTKLLQIIEGEDDRIRQISEIKSSLIFKDIINLYIEKLERSILPTDDFNIYNQKVISLQEVLNLYYNELKYWPINVRIESIKKYLTKRLKDKKDWLIEQIEIDCIKKIKRAKAIYTDEVKKHTKVVQILDEKDEMIKNLNNLSKKLIESYISKINTKSHLLYIDFIKDKDNFIKLCDGIIDKDLALQIKGQIEEQIENNYFETEDLAPIMYIQNALNGISENLTIKHAVIDEAQDFSMFQYFVLKNILKDSSFTILGDVCQGIHSHRGVDNWEQVKKDIFDKRCGLITLAKSYRTTIEIMENANKIIDSLNNKYIKAQPVLRHGEMPEFIQKDSINSIIADMEDRITILKHEGFKSVAIICKTEQECNQFYIKLKKHFENIILVSDKLKIYKGEIVIIPSYLSKGLEFDAVLLSNVSSEIYKYNELDGKLLYVSMTRALHKIIGYYTGECTRLLK